MGRYIGVDLHRNQFTTCTRTENGRNYLRTWHLKELDSYSKTLRPTDRVAVEVTGNTRLFVEAVSPHVSRVVVVNSQKFKVISSSVNKTDENDARRLAFFLSKDMLPEVRMKDQQYARVASLAQTRDKLVKLRTVLKNKINNILSSFGINLKRESLSSDKALQRVLGMTFEPVVELELKVLVDQIRSLNKNIAELEKAINDEGSKLPGYKNIKSIKGIGGLGAGILLSVIGNVNDFPKESKLGSYFGIVPRVANSNQTQHSGRITKRGSKLGRTTLVQCALIAKRYSSYLSDYYERIKGRRGTGKAIIALARKFLGVIFNTLKGNWVWKDFANGELMPAGAK